MYRPPLRPHDHPEPPLRERVPPCAPAGASPALILAFLALATLVTWVAIFRAVAAALGTPG